VGGSLERSKLPKKKKTEKEKKKEDLGMVPTQLFSFLLNFFKNI
jgi:hypothetical protein